MTDIAERPQIIHAVTGEVLPVDAPTVAGYLQDLRQFKQGRLQDEINAAQEWLIDHARQQGAQTIRAGALEVKLAGGKEYSWDIEELEKLRDAGLPEERFADLVKTVVTYKVDARVAKQIASANEEYAKIIDRARNVVEKPVYVTVRG